MNVISRHVNKVTPYPGVTLLVTAVLVCCKWQHTESSDLEILSKLESNKLWSETEADFGRIQIGILRVNFFLLVQTKKNPDNSICFFCDIAINILHRTSLYLGERPHRHGTHQYIITMQKKKPNTTITTAKHNAERKKKTINIHSRGLWAPGVRQVKSAETQCWDLETGGFLFFKIFFFLDGCDRRRSPGMLRCAETYVVVPSGWWKSKKCTRANERR